MWSKSKKEDTKTIEFCDTNNYITSDTMGKNDYFND